MRPTKEQEQFFRLCICVLELCGRICRDILLRYLPVQNCERVSVSQRLRLSKEQGTTVKNVRTKGNYEEFDITLIYLFLRNGCPNFPPPSAGWGKQPTGISVSDDVERIRILRNNAYGHVYSASIDTPLYTQYINELKNICHRMDNCHSAHILYTRRQYQQDLQDILKMSTGDSSFHEFAKNMMQKFQNDLEQMRQNTDEQFEELKNILEGNVSYLGEELSNIKTKMDDLQIAVVVPNHRNSNIPYLQDKSKKALYQHKKSLYTNRRNLEQTCLRMLEECPSLCILVGEKGSGKSSTALEVLLSLESKSCDKYLIHSADELRAIRKAASDGIAILIDGVEGHSYKSESKKRSVQRYIEELNVICTSHNPRILITVNSNILEEISSILFSLKSYRSDNQMIYLNEWPMTIEEKRETFRKYRQEYCHSYVEASVGDLSELDVEELITYEPPYGFASACKMYFTNQTCLKLGIAFFKNTHVMIFQNIKGKYESSDANDKCEFLVLCTVLFAKSASIDEISRVATHLQMKIPDRLKVERATKNLKRQNGIRETDNHSFYEICGFEWFLAVLLAIGRYFPDILLEFADRQILFDFVCSSSFDESCDICCRIPNDRDAKLARKLLDYELDSLHHRTLTDPKFCTIFVCEMFDKYDWCSSVFDENMERLLRAMLETACELTHLDYLLENMTHRLLQQNDKFTEILRDSLFKCVHRGNIEKVQIFDGVSEDIRRHALIEAIKYQKEEIVVHYMRTLKEMYRISFGISVQFSTPRIVEMIFRGFKIPEDEVLDWLYIAVDERKADIVQVFVDNVKSTRMDGKEQKITEIIFRAITHHDMMNFKFLINLFFDMKINLDDVFIQIVQSQFSGALTFFSEFFGKSQISNETLVKAFAIMTRNEDPTFLGRYCNSWGISDIPVDIVLNALGSAIESQLIEKAKILIHNIDCSKFSEQIECLLLKASATDSGDILKIMCGRFNVRQESRFKCLQLAIVEQQFQNARFILSLCDQSDILGLQDHVHEIFISCCQKDDSAAVRGTIDLFGKVFIQDFTIQQGILLSLGNNNIHVLEYLLQEFEYPWSTNTALRKIIAVCCKCQCKSLEKLKTVLRYVQEESIQLEIWESCLESAVKCGNTDTFIFCLEKIGESDGDFRQSVLVGAFTSALKKSNLKAVNFLFRNSYFTQVQEVNKEEIIKLVFKSMDNDLMSYVLSTFGKERFVEDLIELIFFQLIEHKNDVIIAKLIDTCEVPYDLLLSSFQDAVENNNSEIPNLLSRCCDLEFENSNLDRLLFCSLKEENIENIQLIAGTLNADFISDQTQNHFVEKAAHNIGVLEILCNSLDIAKVPEVSFVKFVELAIDKCNSDVFICLLEKCTKEQLSRQCNKLFLNVVLQGDIEMAKIFLDKVDCDNIEIDTIRTAFLVSSERNYGELLDHILDVFGTSDISNGTLKEAFCLAVDKEYTNSLEVIQRRFEIPTELKKEGITSAKSSSVVNELTKSDSDAWPVDKAFSGLIRSAVDSGNPTIAGVLVGFRDTANETKSKVTSKFKNFLNYQI